MEDKIKQENFNPDADSFQFHEGDYARVVGINAVQVSMSAGVRVIKPEDLLRCCGQVVKILSVKRLSDLHTQYKVEFWDRKYHIQGLFLVPSEEKPVAYKRFKVGDVIQIETNGMICYEEIVQLNSSGYKFKSGTVLHYGHEPEVSLFSRSMFRPFDKVLVRDFENETWKPGFFGEMKKNGNRTVYIIIGGFLYYECIPYEGNEHLVYTKNNIG